ncbi:ABC transporter ATP-binding protein [Paractinoplanes maris]|uniref:ABC transporter ATP-binding protein n=1 Tax=Paractinoplanes maris TaxID=1734446 RepID=UPI002020B2E8|nr:ABC transporter ATP-binding protein [Actinoplanes maris]
MTALLVDKVSWHVGAVPIVDDVTLAVEPGEFVALIGPNGAGKTSLFNLVSGLRRPTAGRVVLGGDDVTGAKPHQRARRGLGRTFQTSAVFGSLTVLENVELAVRAREGGATRPWRSRADRAVTGTAERILTQVGLDDRAARTAGELAHGEKRKLEIALVLAGSPRLLLLDEPMAGVSAEDVPALVKVVKALTEDAGRSVLMVEHHMDVVLELADRVAVLHHGALLACGTPAEVMADSTVQEAYLGEAL